MNPRGSALVLSVTLLAVVFGSLAALPAHAQGKSVVITAKCPNDTQGPFNFHMTPWQVEVLQDEPIDWILNTNSADARIVIEAKEGGEWPYAERRHEGNGRAAATQMKPQAAGVYEYSIAIYCGEERIVIDPRIKVGGGSG
jgi:hypothetical protein